MVKLVAYIITFLTVYISHAQLVLKPIHDQATPPALTDTQPEAQGSRLRVQQVTPKKLTLPFWEDFSTSGPVPDTNKWEYGPDVYINATLAQNPPTYKVATFDGLKSDGRAHNITNNFNGAGDSLVSHSIDLSTVGTANRNKVYLSFYWQNKGFGEIPDENDSLRLQFLAKDNESDSNVWVTIWKETGGIDSHSENFTQEILPVNQDRFFHENFKFKFEAFSSQRGPFDTWHIDYIYLDENRSSDSIYYQDRSLSGSPTMLFAPYYEIPASRFFDLRETAISQQQVLATNLDDETHAIPYTYRITNELTGELYFEQDTLEARFLGFNLGKPIVSYINGIELAITETHDSLVLSSSFIYNTTDSFLDGLADINNTITTFYTLHNYYAYDDGTAEFAAGMNQLGDQVAMRFGLGKPDTLTHVDIYIPNIAPAAVGSTIDILVWDKLNKRGELSRQSHTIEPPTGVNKFTRIKLNRPVLTRDTVYIGYQQFIDNYIGIGFDKNNKSASNEVFTNVSETWEQNNRLEGVLMIRPVFSSDTTFALGTKEALKPVAVYPNPSKGLVKIKGRYDNISLYNLSGQLVHQAAYKEEHDLRFLENGLYLMKILSGNSIQTKKIIIAK